MCPQPGPKDITLARLLQQFWLSFRSKVTAPPVTTSSSEVKGKSKHPIVGDPALDPADHVVDLGVIVAAGPTEVVFEVFAPICVNRTTRLAIRDFNDEGLKAGRMNRSDLDKEPFVVEAIRSAAGDRTANERFPFGMPSKHNLRKLLSVRCGHGRRISGSRSRWRFEGPDHRPKGERPPSPPWWHGDSASP